MTNFKIPVAYDSSGQIITPNNAEKGKKYFCPCCATKVFLRGGPKKKDHFFHKAGDACTNERAIHEAAKILIKQVIESSINKNTNPPLILKKCIECNNNFSVSLPDGVDSVVLEKTIDSGFRLDVALMKSNKEIFGIEVQDTHEVDQFKAENIGMPFIEVEANKILDNPIILEPIKINYGNEVCTSCIDMKKNALEIIKNTFHKWLITKDDQVLLKRKCYICKGTTTQEFPDKIDDVKINYVLKDQTIVDVAFLSHENPIAVIGVKTFQSSIIKIENFNKLKIPYMIIAAKDVLLDNLNFTLVHDNFNNTICEKCKKQADTYHDKFINEITRIAKLRNIEVPKEYFLFAPYVCWKCNRETIVFAWPNHDSEFIENKNDNKPYFGKVKSPKTIRYNQSWGWINTCPYCDARFTDQYLYGAQLNHEPLYGPFYGIKEDDFKPQNLSKAQLKIIVQLYSKQV